MSEIDKAIDQAVRRVTDFYERKITALTEQLREADLANVALAGEKRLLAEQLRELRWLLENNPNAFASEILAEFDAALSRSEDASAT